MDKIVYVVWKDINNRKDKNIRVFKRSAIGLEPGDELKFLANVALNRYLGKIDEIEGEYTVEFNDWYRTLKLDLDKVLFKNSGGWIMENKFIRYSELSDNSKGFTLTSNVCVDNAVDIIMKSLMIGFTLGIFTYFVIML